MSKRYSETSVSTDEGSTDEGSTDSLTSASDNGVRSKKSCPQCRWPETSDESNDEESDQWSEDTVDLNVYYKPGEPTSGDESIDQYVNQDQEIGQFENFDVDHSQQEFNSSSEANSSVYLESDESDSGKYLMFRCCVC